jgi:hypothetical protein
VTGLLATLVTVTALTALACAVGLALTVVPFVLSVDLAERRGLSPSRWGGLSLLALVLMAYLGLKAKGHPVLLLPVLALSWAVPLVLSRWRGRGPDLGGHRS